MSIWTNICNIFKVQKKRVEEATTDHVANAEVGVDDSKKLLTEMEQQLFKLRAASKVNETKLTEAEAQVEKFGSLLGRKAIASATAKGEVMASIKSDMELLMEEKKLAEGAVSNAKLLVASNRASITKIESKRTEVKNKIRNAENTLTTKKAELATAEVTSKLEEGFTTFDKGNPLDAVDALDAHVAQKQAEADVAEEMSGEKPANILDRMEAEMGSTSTEDDVAAMIAAAKKKKK